MAFTESYFPMTAPYRASRSAEIVQSWLLGQMALYVAEDNSMTGFLGNECDNCQPFSGLKRPSGNYTGLREHSLVARGIDPSVSGFCGPLRYGRPQELSPEGLNNKSKV